MTELWEHGALDLAEMIRSRQVSSVEVVRAHLERIETVNPHVNAIVRVLGDEALEAAARADRAVADGDEVGALHGVPCTVKENIDLAGTPTTQGIAALAEAVADRDAPIVERMRAAGAIPIGRTNLPDLGLRIHTDSQLYGRTLNPWNRRVTAGGSSGGEAAALATGMSPIGLGNDIGGSLRNPAHCCGVASIKPSIGVVPSATVVPPVDPMLASQLMAVDGPMARRVRDVRAALGVIAGADRRDPVSLPVTLVDADPAVRLRIALVPDPPGGTTESGISGREGLIFSGTPTGAGFDKRVSVTVDLSVAGPDRTTLVFTPTGIVTGPNTADQQVPEDKQAAVLGAFAATIAGQRLPFGLQPTAEGARGSDIIIEGIATDLTVRLEGFRQ